MIQDPIFDVLNKYGEDIIIRMREELLKNGSISSSNLYNSLSYEVKQEVDRVVLTFDMEDYAQYVENGRKPGKYPPINAIRRWTKLKGIPEKAAFPIARKIYKFGITPRPFIKPAMDEYRSLIIASLLKSIKGEIYNKYKKELEYILKKK